MNAMVAVRRRAVRALARTDQSPIAGSSGVGSLKGGLAVRIPVTTCLFTPDLVPRYTLAVLVTAPG